MVPVEVALPIRIAIGLAMVAVLLLVWLRSRNREVAARYWYLGWVVLVTATGAAGYLVAVDHTAAAVTLGLFWGALFQLLAVLKKTSSETSPHLIERYADRDFVESLGWSVIILASGAAFIRELLPSL